jgi:hypothetical protein
MGRHREPVLALVVREGFLEEVVDAPGGMSSKEGRGR